MDRDEALQALAQAEERIEQLTVEKHANEATVAAAMKAIETFAGLRTTIAVGVAEAKAMADNLLTTQTRCSELLTELRDLRHWIQFGNHAFPPGHGGLLVGASLEEIDAWLAKLKEMRAKGVKW